MRKALAALLVVFGSALAAELPPLQPRVIMPDEVLPDSFLLSAPIIAIVRVTAAAFAGPEIEITPTYNLAVRLVKVEVEIESVLHGSLANGRSQFYFFTNTPRVNSYPTALCWFGPGRRYVVFLRKDGNVLRTLTDLTGPSVEIRSGSHNQVSTDSGSTDPGLAVAYSVLTPAADHDDGFAAQIRDGDTIARRFAGPSNSAALLRKLLSSPDGAIRTQACLALSEGYLYRDPCLSQLVDSEDRAVSQRAISLNRGKQANDQMWVRTLREDPTSLTATGSVKDLAGDLEQFTFDASVGVRQQACITLRNLFPSRAFPNCASEPGAK